MKTSYGLEFDTVTEINPEWSDYDKTIAGCHLANARVVIVDTEYGQPIDNEHDLEEIYRILEKKKTGILKMNDMEEKRDNKEIRVRLHHIDRGNCTEVWEVQTEKGKPRRYLGRDDGYGPKEWYTLCDAPYGYCERDCHVREDLTLIVCDKDWNEVLRDGTDRERFPESFPSLDEACNEAWSKVVKVLPHVTHKGFGQWITKQSFLPLSQTEELNWRDSYYEEEASEILSRFTWIGEEYAIFKVTQRHTKCDAQWYEYYAGKTNRQEHEWYTRFFGYEYHDRHISDVLRTLGRRCDDIIRTAVETRTDHYYGRTVSCSWTSSSVTTCPMNRSVTPRNADCARHGKTTTKRTPTITN